MPDCPRRPRAIRCRRPVSATGSSPGMRCANPSSEALSSAVSPVVNDLLRSRGQKWPELFPDCRFGGSEKTFAGVIWRSKGFGGGLGSRRLSLLVACPYRKQQPRYSAPAIGNAALNLHDCGVSRTFCVLRFAPDSHDALASTSGPTDGRPSHHRHGRPNHHRRHGFPSPERSKI